MCIYNLTLHSWSQHRCHTRRPYIYMYMYMYIYMYIYIYIYIHTYICTYIHTHIYMYTLTLHSWSQHRCHMRWPFKSKLSLAFTRYWQYQYHYCMLNKKTGGSEGNHILPNLDCKLQRGAIKEVSSAQNSIDLCRIPE